MRINIDLVAAFIRGGSASVVERLYTVGMNRLTKLHLAPAGRAFRGDTQGQQLNEAVVVKWINSVQPDDAQAVKLLQRLVVSAGKRLGK